jgi:hypothetical protein
VPAPDVLATTAVLFAYGPVPGVELIPYFLALLAWIGLAVGALVRSPVRAAVRLFRRPRAGSADATTTEPVPGAASGAATAPLPEPSVEAPRTAG